MGERAQTRFYQLTFMYTDIRDDETEDKIMGLVQFLGGQKNEDNSDEGQLAVFIIANNKQDMHDLVDLGLSLESINNVIVEIVYGE